MPRQRILITGAGGFIGAHLCGSLEGRHEVFPTFSEVMDGQCHDGIQLDVTKAADVQRVVSDASPDVVIHLAGNKSLSYCEANPDEAYLVNYSSTEYLARAACGVGARFILISSDYVFEGTRGNYAESDETGATTVYGKTKELSEKYVLENCAGSAIVRTAAVYGHGGEFFSWVVQSLHRHDAIEVFADAYFTPTYVGDVVWALREISERAIEGILHVAGTTVTSRFGMASEIARHIGVDADLVRPGVLEGSGLLIARNSSLKSERTMELLGRRFLPLSEGLDTVLGTGAPSQE